MKILISLIILSFLTSCCGYMAYHSAAGAAWNLDNKSDD